MTKLEKWEKDPQELANAFVKKYFNREWDDDFDFWIGDVIGETAMLHDMVFNMSEICNAIALNASKKQVMDWLEYSEACAWDDKLTRIDFKNFIKHGGKTK